MTKYQAQTIQETLDADLVRDAIQENFTPEEVFSNEQLETWADKNGFVKKEE